MPALSDFDPADFEVISDGSFDSGEWDVLSPEEAQRATYRESGDALRLRQQFQREQEREADQSTILERLALGAGQGVRSLESGLGGLFNLAGLTGLGRTIQGNARGASAELADASTTLAGQNPDLTNEWVEQFGAMATQQAPSIAAAALTRSPQVAAIVAGLQSAGQVQDQAEQAYEAQGLSPDDATRRARIPALASGAITGALTALMPGGTERLAAMMFAGPAARNMARESVFGVARRIFGEALREAPEEMIDQLGQAAVAKFSYDPEKPLDEILMETWEAGGWGVGAAGGVGTLGAGVNALDRAAASRVPEQQTGVNLRMPPAIPPVPPSLPTDEFEVVEPAPERVAPENPFYPFVDSGLQGTNLGALLPNTLPPVEYQTIEGEIPVESETVSEPVNVPRLEQIRQNASQRISDELAAFGFSKPMAAEIADAVSTIHRGDLTVPEFDVIDAALGDLDRFGFRIPSGQGKAAKVSRSLATPQNTAALENLKKAAIASIPKIQTPQPVAGTPITAPEPQQSEEPSEIRFPRDPNQFAAPTVRRVLEANMQGRSMDISFEDFQNPQEVHIQSVLGPQAPSWQQLAEAGVINASPNPDGTVNVRVAQPPVADPSEIPNSSIPVVKKSLTTETAPPKSDALRTYEGELANFKQASKDYQKARKNFQTKKIDERSFRAAQKSFDQATVKRDRAAKTYEKALKEEARAGQPKKKTTESSYQRPADIGDWIESHGGMRKFKEGDVSEIAEEWRDAQRKNPDAFNGSSTPDQMAEDYRRDTGKDLTDDQFLSEVSNLSATRKANRDAFFRDIRHMKEEARQVILSEKQKQNFDKIVAGGKERPNSKTVVADQLNPGDKFSVQGHRFTVEKVNVRPDDETLVQSVRLKDDKKFGTQEVGPETPLEIDKRSLKKAAVQPHGDDDAFRRGSQSRETPRNGGSFDNPAFSLAVNPPSKPVSEKVRIVAEALANSPALQGLNFQVETVPAADRSGGLTEMGARIGNLIEVAENADEKVLPHEVAHIVFGALPATTKEIIEEARKTAYKNLIESRQPIAPDERVAAGRMTSQEFKDAGLPIELYPLSNPSEFLAHAFSNTFAQQAIAKADPSLIGKLKVWIAEIWRTIKRALQLGNQMDRVVQDLIDGRLKFDPALAAEQETKVRQSTFVTSAAESRNAAELASSALEQQIEGESQLAQAADITDFLDQFGVNAANSAVRKAFDYGNWEFIRNTGEAINQSRENYRQMKARLANDPYRRARLAGEAGQSILRFGEILDQALDAGSKAFTRMNSRTFQDFIARVQAKAATAQAQQAILTTSKATFDSAIKEASAALKQEARTDRDMAVLQGEIRGIREAAESTAAMEQTLNDMVTVLASTPEGQAALFTGQGGPRTILEIYRDLKRSAGQQVSNPNLLKWAGYILAKSPKLAAKLQAANLAKQTGLRAQLNGMARQLASDFTKDPVATVRRSLRDRERKVRNAMSAEFAFKELEEEMLAELEPLLAAVDAGGIAAKIKADPQFQALRREILNDQTSFGGSPEPAKAMRSAADGSSTITLPVIPGIAGAPPLPMSGATIGIGHEVLDGNVNTLRARWDEQRKAIEFLKNWLAHPANADDPMRRYHAHNLATLENYYGGQQHLMPENQSPLWNRAYSIIGSAVSKSGSRLTGQARSVLNRADQMHKWARDWFDRTVHALPMTQRAAMKSHGIEWNNLTGQSIVQANRIYQQRVGQELAASWARQQGGYNVGDTLSNGEVVTREDMAHLEAQAKAGFDALQIAAKYDEQITKDARGLTKGPNYRSALRTSPYLLPRMFDYQLQAKALAVSNAFKSEPKGAPRTVLEQALNQLWPDIGASLVVDRNPEFSKRTIFDGKGSAFEVVANIMRSNPGAIPSIDALATELSVVGTMTKDQAKEIVLDEFGRIVSQWSAAVEEKVAAAEQGGKAGDAKNSFTQARGDALAPWTFYKTGFTTTDDISNHAAGMQSVSLDRVIATLEAIKKDLDRQQNDLDTKAKEFERLGKPNAIRSAVELKELERRRGHTYDSWENLKGRKANIEAILQNLQTPSVSGSDFDLMFNRGTGALVGAVIGNTYSTLKNISAIFLGRQLRAAGMDEFNSTLRSALFTKAEALKIIASLGYGGVRSVGYLVRGMARGVPQLLKGNAREAYLSALRDVIREMSENVPRRLESVREMEAAGVYQLPDKVAAFDNQILGSILYRGGIPANEFHGAAKLGGYAAGLFEATILAVANAGFPTIGDAAVNGAMWNAVNSRFGPVQGMEDSLRELYAQWTKGGLPRTFNLQDPADPVNRLSPKEIGLTEPTLSQVRRTYQMAGMSFDERAAAYLRELQSNPKAQFLTDENRQALTNTLIDKMNRASFSNAPLKFKDGSFLSNMVRPLYGWSVRSFADWEQSIAIPTNTESGRMKLWATAMLMAGVALAMTGAVGQLQDELMARLVKRGLYSQESANRLPWEEQTTGRKIANWTRLSMESVPLLGIAGNMLIPANNAARASYEPTLFVAESAKALAGWIHGIIATGDPSYGLTDLISRFVPDSKIILNRIESQAGRRAGSNAVADIKRFADPELVRPQYKGAVAGFVDESTPWKRRMENAAQQQDWNEFNRAAREAAQVMMRNGKKPAEAVKAVQGYWRSRDPETRALTRRQTPQEYAQMLERARAFGKDHADEILRAKQNWARAGAMIGVRQRDSAGTNRVNLRAPSLSRVGRGMARY